MKNIGLLFTFLMVVLTSKAQEHAWAFGFYGDVQLESPNYNGSFGIQGKYDLDAHSAAQAQVYGRNGYVSAGIDYLFSLLDKDKSNFNVFLGAGYSQDFYRYNEIGGEAVVPEERENHPVANGQVGVSYYFPDVNISIYAGYKAKYQFDWEEFDPNFVMVGFRYHLW